MPTNNDVAAKAAFDSARAEIRRKVADIRYNNNPNAKTQQNNYVIPVVFHLVGGNAASLTDAEVIAQLTKLNTAFSNSLGSTYSAADDAQIKFCLAQTLPDGNAWSTVTSYNSSLYTGSTPGITRCTTSVANTVAYNHNMDLTGANSQQALLNIAYTGFNSTRYLNIWVVERISIAPSPYSNVVAGYGTIPVIVNAIEGVIMRLGAFGINTSFTNSQTSQGGILVHEVGHYLGLFHTFQNGCMGTTTVTCYSAGDECCDTPPVAAPNQNSCSFFASTPPDGCTETPTNFFDMYENHMDYQYDDAGNCRNTFTNDQVDRMHSAIQLYRPNLVSFSNHIFTGLTNVGGCQAGVINPGFSINGGSSQVCTGQTIGFTAAPSATTYTWNFAGGSPSTITGTNAPTGITYSSPGTYNVTLNITDGLGNNYSSTSQIYVTTCTTYSGSKANWYFGENSISLTNCGLSFTTGIAVPTPSSAMQTMEASAAISNSSGNLLFYTNGRSVWNNTHVTMPNGNNTLNGSPNVTATSPSASQGTVIMPKPGSSSRYYIYTTSDISSTSNPINYGISQYEVDMSVSGGTVISTTPVNPTENYSLNESVIAVPHHNGTDYWLIVKPRNNTATGLLNAGSAAYSSNINQYLVSYSVSSSGISNTPVISLSAPYTPPSSYAVGDDGVTSMAISNNKKIFCIIDGGASPCIAYLYYFDCSNGHFNYLTSISGINSHGICFSPNSKVLYARSASSIIQYDLSNISVCSSAPPSMVIATGYPDGSLQLGPDNKIYIAYNFQPNIGVINFPNNINTTSTSNECGHNGSSIALIPGTVSRLDLPNDIIGQNGALPDDFSFCIRNCGQGCFTTLSSGNSFAWNFGDGYSITGTNTVIPAGTNAGTTSGNYEYPCHTYSATGTYTVTLSIDGRTAVTHTLNYTAPPTPTITGPSSVCATNTVSPSYYYGPTGYTYSWTATNATPSTGTANAFTTAWTSFPATLSLTITDPNTGCSATSSITVNIFNNMTVTSSPSLTCSGSTSTLSASGSTTYSWSTGATTNSIVVTPPATTVYIVSGTTGGCTNTKTITVNPTPTITATANIYTICAGQTVTLSSTGTSTYTWNPSSLTGSSVSVTPSVTTTYTVTGANICGITTTNTVTINVNALPSITITASNPVCTAGQSTTLTASGASMYSWSTGSSTSTTVVNPTTTTNYLLGATGANGCGIFVTYTVFVTPVSLTVTPVSTTICAGVTTTLSVTGATTYSWNTGATTASISVTPAATTIYTVVGTNTLGCTNTKTVSVTVTPNPTVSVSNRTICAGTSTVLTASGATTYSWNTGASTNTISVSPSSTTVYTVTGTTNGCTNTKTVSVSVTPNPTVSVSNRTICAGTSTVLTASGATTYSWNTGATTNTISVSPTSTTVYTVTGTTNGCTNTKTVSVTVTANPTVAVNNATICAGTSTVLTASGATTYSWNTGATTNTVSVSPSSTTVYTVTGTTSGCTNTKTVTVNINPNPTVTAVANPTSICVGQTATLTAGGATTYSWNTGATTTTIGVNPTVTTTYTATGTNSVGCLSTKTVSVIVGPVTPTITASSSSVNVCAGVTATLTGSGATNYTWMPGGINTTTAIVSPTAAIIYTLSGNSGAGCNTATTTLLVNPIISTLCCTAANSSITTSTITAGAYTTVGTVIDVSGVITFTGNTSYNGYTFRMKPNALLRVMGEYTLTLTNCKLFSCSELWNGIELVTENSDDHGHLALNNTTIEDMYNGVFMDGLNLRMDYPVTNAIITSTASALNKNYTSIQFKNIDGMYNVSAMSYTTVPYPFSLKTTTISTNASTTSPGSTLKPSSTYTYAYNTWAGGATSSTNPPFLNFPRAFIGISLTNMRSSSNIIIGDSTTAGNTNVFDNMDFGIKGTEASAKVHNNYFKNITGSTKQTANGESYPAFGPDEIGIAIAMTHTSTNVHALTVGTHTVIPSSNPYPKGNRFEDCNRGVYAIGCANVYAKANTFTATATSTVPVYGVDAYYYYKNQSAIWINAQADLFTLSYNYIRNFSSGIYSNHTTTNTAMSAQIRKNDIKAPSSTGFCKQAIQVAQTGGSNMSIEKFRIEDNAITEVYNGILAGGVPNCIFIRNNNVSIEPTTKSLAITATTIRTAIRVSNSNYAMVQANSVTNSGAVPTTSTTANYITGIHVSGSTNTKVECNNAYHLGRGFVFGGSCGNSSWKVNTMSDSYRGLELQLVAIIGAQGAASGTPNLSANTWTTITQETYVLGTNPNSTSKLYLKANVPPNPKTEPTLNFGTNAYSIFNGGINPITGTSYTCNAGNAQRMANSGGNTNGGNNQKTAGTSSDSLTELTNLAMANEDSYEVFADEMMYQNKQFVYQLIEQDSINPAKNSTLSTFYSNTQNTAIDKLTEAQIAIANFDISAASTANSSAPVVSAIEQKQQRANTLVLKYMNDRNYGFTDAEKSELRNMANECVVKGDYVTHARNLVDVFAHTTILYDDECEAEANISRKKKIEDVVNNNTLFNLFPNPNNGTMQLDYKLGSYSTAKFNLFDITGKLIQTKTLETNEGSLNINEQNLRNGVYFYTILVGEKNIKTDKIVIIK